MNTKYRVPNFIWLECMNLKFIKVMCPLGHVLHRAWYPERGSSRYRDCPECIRRYGIGQLKLDIVRFRKDDGPRPVYNDEHEFRIYPTFTTPDTIRP